MSEYNAVVLIVDDDQNIAKYLSSLMRGEGFKTLQAHDGKTALELVRSEKPDVMLLDIKLPDMDGMEVLRQTKDLDQNLPIIVMTGYSETSGAIRAIKAGAFEYLGSPPREFLSIIGTRGRFGSESAAGMRWNMHIRTA